RTAARPARDAEAVARLRAADPVLAGVIDRVSPGAVTARRRRRPNDHYGVLVRAIVGQQVSTKAAQAIWERLSARYGGSTPTPAQILAEDPEQLRAGAGLSRAKTSYLRSLAEHVLDGSLELHKLGRLPDGKVIQELTAVKGLGEWSAHIFLIFHLRREDVLALGDLGIRRATMLAYGLAQLPPPAQLEAIAEPWRPHRTLACLYLWESLHVAPV
ncbi:MAG: DNA-3-methyladenine glycosylase family protein, partial [Solirubrobacteraceae bacterium]